MLTFCISVGISVIPTSHAVSRTCGPTQQPDPERHPTAAANISQLARWAPEIALGPAVRRVSFIGASPTSVADRAILLFPSIGISCRSLDANPGEPECETCLEWRSLTKMQQYPRYRCVECGRTSRYNDVTISGVYAALVTATGFKPGVASAKAPGGFDSHPLPLPNAKPSICRGFLRFLELGRSIQFEREHDHILRIFASAARCVEPHRRRIAAVG